MNVQKINSRCLFFCLLWALSIFSSVALGVTEQVRVSSSNDDAEELKSNGDMYRNSTDLELGYDDYFGGIQIVGMRFRSVNIPQGATINSAYIEFVTDEMDSGTTNLVIVGEDHDSPIEFNSDNKNISKRIKTSASVNWAPSAWNSTNERHQTPDISAIIQEIVDRTGWSANNNLVLIVEPGSGCTSISCQRTAESRDGKSNSAPLLVVDYTVTPTKLSVSTENVIQEYAVSSYGGGQDIAGTVEVRDAGLSLFLEGNRWQKIDFPYTVTADTVIEFDFQSTVQGEIHGLGFDNDNSVSSDRSFQVYGTQNWGISDFSTYSGSGITHYTIPVGKFYTGNFQYLFFINDNDSNLTGNSLYSNILVYENTEPLPLVEYRFEEDSWNGTAGEILDSTGNGHHARVNDSSIPENTFPALSGNLGTCGYASQNDGSIAVTGLPLDTSTNGVKTTVTFWMNWDGTNNVMPIGWDVHDIWIVSGSIGFNTGNGDVYGVSSAGLANGWHHVAVEFTNGSVTSNRMYIDGVEQVLTQRQSSPNNARAYVDAELRIGGWSYNSSYDFHGLMDEVRVYQGSLTTSQVNTIMTERHPCPATPLAEYRFDELSWSGVAGEVMDSSGNINHGTVIGGINTSIGKVCNAADIPSNDSASTVEAVDTGLDLDTIIGSSGTISLWYKGNSAWNSGSSGSDKRLFDATDGDKYFFAEISSHGQVKFWFEDGLDGDYQKTTVSTFTVGAGIWKHLTFAWDVTNDTAKIYVDGVEQIVSGGSGGATPFTGYNTLYFGDNRHATYLTGQLSADGLIDEALVFDTVLASSQIQSIFNNQNAGNNYDGSERICPTPAIPLVEYRFEEASWNGTADEILDNTGNDYHAQVINNSTRETAFPALSGDPGTCGYASQNDGSIQVTGLPLNTVSSGVKTTVTFWMNWDGTDNVMPLGWNFHDIWLRNGSMGFNTFGSDIYGISSAGLANGWHHVAVEFTNGSVTSNRMYIDGVEQVLTQRFSTPINSRAFVNSQMRVGGVSNSSSYNFHGLLDEFRVYEGILTTAQVITIMNERHDCNTAVIHHYEISHDGQGLTCDTESVTVKACTDESCSNLSTEPVTLDFLADGTLISTPTFTGSTTVSFNHTDVETLTLSVANTTITASNPIVCENGSSASCDMVFTNAGFRFLYGTGNSIIIANQKSGAEFGEVLKLQAVKDIGGVCTGLFNGNKNVDLWQENVDPGGTNGLSFTIVGTNIAKHSGAPSTKLNFGGDSIATIPSPIYHDAGKIRVHANYAENGVTLSGSSNAFWVSPAKLVVSAKSGTKILNGDTAGTTNLDGVTVTETHKAGGIFDLTVTAYNAATPADVTPNYSPGQIQFKLARTGPTLGGSVDGDLIYAASSAATLETSTSPIFQNVTLSSFSSGTPGVSTFSGAQYSEVGLLNLDVQDSAYGNVGIIIPAEAIDIGRFTPDHFKQTVVEHGAFTATCDPITGSAFAYSGQKDEVTDSVGAIFYFTNPILAITAYNKQGDITQNYFEDSQGSVNDYMKLSDSGVTVIAPTEDRLAIGVDANKLMLTTNMNSGVLSQNDLTTPVPADNPLPKGVLHYKFSDDDNFFYNRSANALVTPFTSFIDFSTSTIIDADAVDLVATVGSTTTDDASPAGVEIRFGRLRLENSFGPETSNLPQPMQIEHFNGTTFILTTDDNCTSYDASNISLTNNVGLDLPLPNAQGGTGNFVAGKTQVIELVAPGAGDRGKVDVSYDVYDWLKFDWKNDGVYINPSATATFGIFRGNDRIIYWREVTN